MKNSLILLILSLASCVPPESTSLKIIFGSCSNQEVEEQLWSEIAKQRADIFILSGDNIYADGFSKDRMIAAYKYQKAQKGFREIVDHANFLGVWDDHDYGANDGGKNHLGKEDAKEAFLHFLNIPEDAAVRQRSGVYQSHFIEKDDIKVKVVLLDTRYFRDTLVADTLSRHRYMINEQGDILGERQWKWLENELQDHRQDITLLVSSIQVLSDEHFFEKWSLFPQAKQRLFEVIRATQPPNLILLSGDRHIAEISKINLDGYYLPLYDITSSGLSHTWSQPWKENNPYRQGELIIKRNYGQLDIEKKSDALTVLVSIKGHQDSTFLVQKIIM